MSTAQAERSPYRGVTWHVSGRWHATVKVADQQISLGYALNPVDAAMAYDYAVELLRGPGQRKNFPQKNLDPLRQIEIEAALASAGVWTPPIPR
ncbi:MAG: hypothetical protein ACOY3P_20095 [Planctomycetota bacterium]